MTNEMERLTQVLSPIFPPDSKLSVTEKGFDQQLTFSWKDQAGCLHRVSIRVTGNALDDYRDSDESSKAKSDDTIAREIKKKFERHLSACVACSKGGTNEDEWGITTKHITT